MTAPARPLRRDAAENREKLIDAAMKVFAEYGLEASVEQVAREAGVGMGTLYRRFPHKQALIDELVGGVRRQLLALALAASDRADGTGLEQVLLEVGRLQADQPGCLQQLWGRSDAGLESMTQFRAVLAQLLTAAQQAGRVRDDVVVTDVTMLFWALRAIIESTRRAAPQAWRRHLELQLAGLRPVGGGFPRAALEQPPLAEAVAVQISSRPAL